MFIALDIGGTKIKYGLVSDNGEVIKGYSRDTEANKGADNLIKIIKEIVYHLKEKCSEKIKGIAISTAGQVNSDKGEIIFATDTLPGWTGVELKKIIEEEFKLSCFVDNDVNSAAMGEAWKGVGKEVENFICLTLGTGIGGAIVINGEIFPGQGYSSGEFGHMVLYPKGKKCTCGQRGCFEQYASTSALIKRVNNSLEINGIYDEVDGEFIFNKFFNGDEIYSKELLSWIEDISLGLKNLIHIFNPQLIVIGGGVCAQGEKFIKLINKELNNIVMPSFLKGLKVETASCGNDAGMIGAVYGLKKKLNINNYAI